MLPQFFSHFPAASGAGHRRGGPRRNRRAFAASLGPLALQP